mmetsp:Transcript_76052/g.204068  ORF Transcript_76052/g.204068 Transcript_76052/m.204068 type:complete len:99 (+) Transcript_76052:608-904(+)
MFGPSNRTPRWQEGSVGRKMQSFELLQEGALVGVHSALGLRLPKKPDSVIKVPYTRGARDENDTIIVFKSPADWDDSLTVAATKEFSELTTTCTDGSE